METVADTEEGRSPAASAPPELVVEVVILSVRGADLVVLLTPAHDGLHALPQTVPRVGETLDQTAASQVQRLTRHADAYVRQLYTWGEPAGSGNGRALQVSYIALSPAEDPEGQPAGVGDCRWWSVEKPPPLVPRHERTLRQAREYLEERLPHTHLAWSLLPDPFTLSELQVVYEVVQRRALDKRNFRKWLLSSGLVEPTGRLRCEGAHRPARLYRFTTREPRPLD
jgi:8-oxo-dGTP diphosphatase